MVEELQALVLWVVDRLIRFRVVKVESLQQVSFTLQNIKKIINLNLNFSVASSAASAKKRAPNAPGNNQQQQPIYGTLPHSVGRYQQSYDLSDIYNSGNNISTLPHPPKSNSNNVSPNQQQQHFDNKVYERFEPYINKTSHKRSPSSDSISRSINLGE